MLASSVKITENKSDRPIFVSSNEKEVDILDNVAIRWPKRQTQLIDNAN